MEPPRDSIYGDWNSLARTFPRSGIILNRKPNILLKSSLKHVICRLLKALGHDISYEPFDPEKFNFKQSSR